MSSAPSSVWPHCCWAPTGIVIELQGALNAVWKVKPKPNRGVWGVVRTRILSVAMILSLGFLLLVSLVVSAALAALSSWLRSVIGDVAILGWFLDAVVALAVISTMVALIYKMLPDARVAWRDVWVGAGATAVLSLLGKYLIGLYIGKASVGSAFGAAGSLAVLLVWILLLGSDHPAGRRVHTRLRQPFRRQGETERAGGSRRSRRRTPAGPGRAAAKGLSAGQITASAADFPPAPWRRPR